MHMPRQRYSSEKTRVTQISLSAGRSLIFKKTCKLLIFITIHSG